MPTYDYVCDACGHSFEKFQSITASVLRKCPECGKMKLKRLIGSGAGIIFKGSGFYQTDYRSENYKSAAKSDTTPAPKTETKSKNTKPKKESKPKADAKKPSPSPKKSA